MSEGQGDAISLLRDIRGIMRWQEDDKGNVENGFRGNLCVEQATWSKGSPVPSDT